MHEIETCTCLEIIMPKFSYNYCFNCGEKVFRIDEQQPHVTESGHIGMAEYRTQLIITHCTCFPQIVWEFFNKYNFSGVRYYHNDLLELAKELHPDKQSNRAINSFGCYQQHVKW